MKTKFLCILTIMLVLVCTFSSCATNDKNDDNTSGICVHQWSDWQITKPVTCTEDGATAHICEKCDKIQELTINAKGHLYSDWKTTKQATCTEDGISMHICENCGKTQELTIDALGHSYGDWLITQEKTCSKSGAEERTCTTCQNKETKAIAAIGHHSFGDWVITKNATCMVDGTKERICVCGEKQVEAIAASHNYVNGICSVCNDGVINITTPDTPITLNRESISGEIYNTLTIASLRWEVAKNNPDGTKNIIVYYSGEKTYNSNEVNPTSTCYFVYKLYDAEGYVVARGVVEIYGLTASDKFKSESFTINNLNPNQSYTLVLCEYN